MFFNVNGEYGGTNKGQTYGIEYAACSWMPVEADLTFWQVLPNGSIEARKRRIPSFGSCACERDF